MSIFEFDDQQGVRTRGTLRAPGATPGDVLTVGMSRGTVTPAPGGGSQPVLADYEGVGVLIADGFSEALTWDALAAGTELLDRTDLAAPTVLEAGTYLVAATVSPDAALTANGYAQWNINTSAAIIPLASFIYEGAVLTQGYTQVGFAFLVLEAGETITVNVANRDGVAARTWTLNDAQVLKIA